MIEINLARKRKFQALVSKESEAVSTGKSLLAQPGLRRVLLGAIVIWGMWTYWNNYQAEELNKINKKISIFKKSQNRLRIELAKVKAYEKLKPPLDKDEFMLRTKIQIMKKVVEKRDQTFQLLFSIAQVLPKDAWLEGLEIQDKEVELKGSALNYSQVSDIIQNLGKKSDFSDVSLKSTKKEKDTASGVSVVRFAVVGLREGTFSYGK